MSCSLLFVLFAIFKLIIFYQTYYLVVLIYILSIKTYIYIFFAELSPMQSYATTSSGRGAGPLQAQGRTEEEPYYPPEELLHYYSEVDAKYHPIVDPKSANLKKVNGYYVGIYVAPGRAHPIFGVKPHYNSCIQRIEPYTFEGQEPMLVTKLQKNYDVFYRRLKLT